MKLIAATALGAYCSPTAKAAPARLRLIVLDVGGTTVAISDVEQIGDGGSSS